MTLDALAAMGRARDLAERARVVSPPNPWVGAVVLSSEGEVLGEGSTAAPGGPHAEVSALAAAGSRATGATVVVTLEPCSHVGRTGPCTAALTEAGVARVVVGTLDPDERVSGRGVTELRRAGIDVEVGVDEESVRAQLAPYLWHRRTGRPFVVAKVAATLDGAVAMRDGSSQWITSEAAREESQWLRARSQAILVGAGTVRRDDPRLSVRLAGVERQPLRVVLGHAPAGAKVHPCLERSGELGAVLDELGGLGVVQLLVEGGPATLSSFLEAGLVNRLVWYVAPALAGGGARGAVEGLSTPTLAALRRGRVVNLARVGDDVRVEVEF
jgi:diaminohydroxyphosphoribosylaminopyrimidine deaminase/5-amino-6-(5-phosphoribosylamino)uracil reductase